MRAVFIINPAAGNGSAVKKWHQFKKTLSFPYEEWLTERQGHAAEIVRSYQTIPEPVLLIGFGGDGTMSEIAAGAAGSSHLLVASVSAGSGNDFSRGYRAFSDGREIEVFLRSPRSKETDFGILEGRETFTFINSAGIGFDAEVSKLANRSSLKRRLNGLRTGKLIYGLTVIRSFFAFRRFSLKVEMADEQHHFQHVWFATISNQPYFGGGMKISPLSDPADGLLELTIVQDLSRLRLLLLFGTVFTGSHTRFKEVVQFRSPEYRLTADEGVCRHADGEYAGKTGSCEIMKATVSDWKWQVVQ